MPVAILSEHLVEELRQRGPNTVPLWGSLLDEGDVLRIEAVEAMPGLTALGQWSGGECEPSAAIGGLHLLDAHGGVEASLNSVPVKVEILSTARLFARQRGLLDRSVLEDRRVLVVGLGSMGSEIARGLAMSGVGRFRLVDKDRLSPENASRHAAGLQHVGRLKTRVMAELIGDRNPDAEVEEVASDFVTLPMAQSQALFSEVDLAICAADEEPARIKLGHMALATRTPHLFTGCHENAASGQVLYCMPGWGTPCYFCFLANAEGPRQEATVDYSSATDVLHLPAQPGLHGDIAQVSLVALKVALQLLSLGRIDEDRLDLLNPDKTLFLVGNRADGELFTRPLETRFVGAARNPECPRCSQPTAASPLRQEREPLTEEITS